MRLASLLQRPIALFPGLSALVMVLPLLLDAPSFTTGFFPRNKDVLFYLNALSLMQEGLLQGELPRWAANANAGLGSPLFYLHAPLAYLLTAIFALLLKLLGASLLVQYVFGMWLAITLSGFTCFAWLRGHFERKLALLGACLYIALPYKWVYVYLHGNLANLWVLAWLPLWMLACDRILARQRYACALYAISLALVALTHPLTLIAFSAIPLLYVLVFDCRRIVMLALAHVWGFALAAFYLLPMQLNRDLIQTEKFLRGEWFYIHNFDHIDSVLTLYYFLPAALLLGLASRHRHLLAQPLVQRSLFWGAVLLGIGFMSLSISDPLWRMITVLQYLQFPATRLHAGALIAVVFLIPAFLDTGRRLPALPKLYHPTVIWVAVLVFTAWTFVHVRSAYLTYEPMAEDLSHTIRSGRIIMPLEYMPRNLNTDDFVEKVRSLAGLPFLSMLEGDAKITLQSYTPQLITLQVDVQSLKGAVLVRQFWMPTWQEESDTSMELQKETGLIAIPLTHGVHTLTLRQWWPGEGIGEMISLAAIAALLASIWRARISSVA